MAFILRQILKERRITIGQLSEASGISQSNLSNYMAGKVSPTLDTLNRIAKSLDIDISDLFRKEEDLVICVKYKGKLIELSNDQLISFIKRKIDTNKYGYKNNK